MPQDSGYETLYGNFRYHNKHKPLSVALIYQCAVSLVNINLASEKQRQHENKMGNGL